MFHNVEFKQIAGAIPEMIFLNKKGEEIERIDLTEKTREECNAILEENKFYKKATPEEEVPPEFKDAPYTRHESEL